jgi:heptaprenyl diphosphate synthase
LDDSRRTVRTEVFLTLMAIAIGVLEGLIPRPVPFLKPGLANIATVAGIVRFGPWMGVRINLLRSVGAALFLGTLATPTFILSLSGGMASAAVMGLCRRFFSVTGLSVSGSMASMAAQLAAAGILLPGLPLRALILPVAAWGALAGLATGLTATILLRKGFPWIGGDGVDSVQPLT